MNTWTELEIELVKQTYPSVRTDDIAKQLGKTKGSVYHQAYKLGLKKTDEFLKSELSGIMVKGDTRGFGARFKKGEAPHNKGKVMTSEMKERIKHTFYQKGHKPHNTKYDGAISIRTEVTGYKYAYVRIYEGNWDLLHRVVWQKYNGAIPEGYNVAFKDGNSLNCNNTNLYLISKQDNMLRNTIHRYPEDLKILIRNLNKLYKTIRSHDEQNKH